MSLRLQPSVRRCRPLHAAVLAVAALLLAGCGGGSGDAGAGTPPATGRADDPAAVVRLQWGGPVPLFTASGQQQALQVQALDAQGRALNVPVTWQSGAPGVVQVAAPASGTTGQPAMLTAHAGAGQAVLTATVGSRSLSAVAVVAQAAPGTVVLADAQVEGEPVASAEALSARRLKPGSTYTVTLQAGVAAPAVGSLVLGQGSKAIAGEVVAVNGRVITLALVPLKRLLPQLTLDLDLPLQPAPARTRAAAASVRAMAAGTVRPLAETEFSLAGFECKAEGSAGGVELAKKDVLPTGLDSLRYRVLWSSQRQLLRLSGQPGVQFEVEPTAKIAFTGKVNCQLELADIPIPLPPSIGLFLGVGFPVGVGFTLEGALPVNGVALNLKGQAQAAVVVGFDCNPGCASLNSITPSGSVTPTVTAPEFAANRLDLSGQVYAWANFEGGARWSSTLQFDAIEAQAGLKFATTLASEHTQAKDAAAAADYKLSFEASAAPTEALGDFASLVGLVLDQAKFETSVPLGRSPTAGFQIDKRSFKALDDVSFQLNLAADEVQFPLLGYNVQMVRVYRKTTADDGSYVLTLVGEQTASSGQTQFTIPWLATVDSGANIGFVAFVQTRLLSGQRWQLGSIATGAPLAPARLSAGTHYACAIDGAGAAKCWGRNMAGVLGDGSQIDRTRPVQVAGLDSGVQALSAGEFHACAVTGAGGVACWGSNIAGQLGRGTAGGEGGPAGVQGLASGVVAVSAGAQHSCALTSAGAVKCWGSNYYGQLGDGAPPRNAEQLGSGALPESAVPVDVAGLGSGVVAISAGLHFTCALTSAGAVKCWGENSKGQLGTGVATTSDSANPTPAVVAGLGSGVAAIAAGGLHACALTRAGSVKCWGSSVYGQLGNGLIFNSAATSNIASATPVDVAGLGADVTAIAAGRDATCAITRVGAAFCWGDNGPGSLGDGTNDNRATPVAVVGLGARAVAISVGFDSTCALLETGRARCWGMAIYGQLGDGRDSGFSATPVDVANFP